MMPVPGLVLRRPEVAEFAQAAAAEWLLTNGLGSYASGTVALACTRRYHGLLVAALNPPVGRTVLVAKCDVIVDYRGQRHALGANEYADGTLDPQGYLHLESFELVGRIPVWTWRIGDLTLRQRLWMPHGEQTCHLKFEVLTASAPVTVTLHPLCTHRDYHAHAQAGTDFAVEPVPGGCAITPWPGAMTYRLLAEAAVFTASPAWHRRVHHRVERERGLDDEEDLFHPGTFTCELAAGEAVTLTCTVDRVVTPPELGLRRELARQRDLLASIPAGVPNWVRQLALAADQFVVRRGTHGVTLIAGYPWFTDWGRDTMIALPGLTLATGRIEVARRILETFAEHVSQGMLPNRFPDSGEVPEYNTVDATLWFFDAIAACLEAAFDHAFAARLYPVLVDIVDWHLRGTRHGIHVDARDGLLAAGAPGQQLTWMDARVGTDVITPRHGKPVEVNALWQRALRVLAALAARLDFAADAQRFASRAAQHADAFRQRFWCPHGWLYDVVDTPDGSDDGTLRPNQILAVSLTPDLLSPPQSAAVVARCVDDLWTPYGLRSLARTDPAYHGVYTGDPARRDRIYHQGTAWSWLLGPLARAHYQVHRDPAQALALLEPLSPHLRQAGLGTIGEIFDGDAPHRPRGCIAQAWGVATVLEAWVAIQRSATAFERKEANS